MREVLQRRRGGRALAALLLVLAAGALVLGFDVLAPAPPDAGAGASADAGGDVVAPVLPEPVEPAFVPGAPRALGSTRDLSRFAPVRRPTTARAGPRMSAAPVAELATTTPEGTQNIVLVLGRTVAADGRIWARVNLAVLPNGTTGWVPREALGGYGAVRTRLVVDLRALTATLLRGGRPVFRADVGVGRSEWPTPRGEFYVRNKLTKFANAFYGPLAFGTSARSEVLTDWPAGGFVGIHGTNRPDLLPGRVSHGCIRLRNEDILRLARLMPVGTPLTIR
ncbi:MAG TPA: L,D-transpeptidase [Gaiellaceae bacterium]|nr:L,D-transpeptidase [Gaiellaceae bacterium]